MHGKISEKWSLLENWKEKNIEKSQRQLRERPRTLFRLTSCVSQDSLSLPTLTWTSDPLVFTSQVLELQTCTAMPSLVGPWGGQCRLGKPSTHWDTSSAASESPSYLKSQLPNHPPLVRVSWQAPGCLQKEEGFSWILRDALPIILGHDQPQINTLSLCLWPRGGLLIH